MSETATEPVKRQVVGRCKEIGEKNGWTTFHVDIGSQYPYRLQTKLEALIKLAREAKQDEAVWTFSESQGGEIPNQPGKHYMNRRLEKVEVGGTPDPALLVGGSRSSGSSGSGGSRGGGGGGYQDDSPEKRASIERQTIVKGALAALPEYAEKQEDAFFALLDRLDDWMGRGRAGSEPVQQQLPDTSTTSGSSTSSIPAADEYPDDDIPF